MKKSLLIVLLSFFLFPLGCIAAEGLFDTGPAPAQSFRAAGSAKTSNQKIANPMAKVKAIMAEAKKEQLAKQKTNDTHLQNDNAVSEASKPNSSFSNNVNNLTAQDLATEISTLNQTNLLFHEQTDQKIEALSDKNRILEEKIQKLDEVLILLNQEVTQMNHELQLAKSQLGSSNSAKGGWMQQLDAKWGGGAQYLIYAILLALIVVVSVVLTRQYIHKNNQFKQSKSDQMKMEDLDDEVSGEYDFMGSEEAIPAKLDLARAYISMEDFTSAQSVLDEVMSRGNKEQCKIAQELMNKIPSKS